MSKAFKPVVIAANDLLEGDSIYLGYAGWVRDVAKAIVINTENESDAVLTASAAQVGVIGPYAVQVSLETGTPWPLARRERIKASRGTTIPVGPAAEIRIAA